MARPKGSKNRTTKEAREVLNSILEGELQHIAEALEAVRVKSPARYLDLVCKMLPYIVPKQMQVHEVERKELNLPEWMRERVEGA